jgi:hypothetical protein
VNIIKELRDAASACPVIGVSVALRKVADELALAMTEFTRTRSAHDLREVNGLYSFAQRVLNAATVMPDPIPPQSDAVIERLAA